MMQSFPLSDIHLLQERYLERQAIPVCRSATFLDCLQARGVAPTIQMMAAKRKEITITDSQIYGARTKFFATLELGLDLQCVLMLRGEELVSGYTNWLLHEYTERYRSLSTPRQLDWLAQVVTPVVTRFLMEQKYEVSLLYGKATFADPWACGALWHLQTLHTLPSLQARLNYHIVRDPEQRQALTEQFWAELDVRLQGHLVGIPDPLPPLPEGVQLPFAQLTQKKEETHE